MRWLVLLALLIPSNALALEGWNFSTTVTIDADSIDADITDYVLRVDLSHADFADLRANGSVGSLTFTEADGTTELDYDLENDTLNGWALVGPTNVSGTVDTDIIAWYGGGSKSENPSGVYTGFWGVYHMNETQPGTLVNLGSHATHLPDLAATDSLDAGDLVAGKVGNCINYDRGMGEYHFSAALNVSDADKSMTWMFSTRRQSIFDMAWAAWTFEYFEMYMELATDQWQVLDDDGLYETVHTWPTDESAVWHNVGIVVIDSVTTDTGTMTAWVDGVAGTPTAFNPIDGDWVNDTFNLGTSQSPGSNDFDGDIDELWIAAGALSDAWMAAWPINTDTPTTFYSVSAQVAYIGGGGEDLGVPPFVY